MTSLQHNTHSFFHCQGRYFYLWWSLNFKHSVLQALSNCPCPAGKKFDWHHVSQLYSDIKSSVTSHTFCTRALSFVKKKKTREILIQMFFKQWKTKINKIKHWNAKWEAIAMCKFFSDWFVLFDPLWIGHNCFTWHFDLFSFLL